MDENAFFKLVWRFNALAIAGAVVVGGLVALYGLVEIIRYQTRDREVTNVVDVGASTGVKDTYILGSPMMMPGLEIARIPLYRTQSRDLVSYSKSSVGNEVNFLFLNTAANTGAWMLPNTNQLFLESRILTDQLSMNPSDKRVAVGLVHTVVETDSDGDGKLTSRDLAALTVSGPDGKNYRKLVDGLELIYSAEQVSADRLLAIYVKDKQTISEIYRIPDMSLISQQTIPTLDVK